MNEGKNLKKIRQFLDLGQEEFAEALGFSKSYQSQMEQRATLPNKLKDKVSVHFNVKKEYLNTGNGDMFGIDIVEDEAVTYAANKSSSLNKPMKELLFVVQRMERLHGEVIIMMNDDGKIIYVNTEIEQQTGFSPLDLLGKTLEEVFFVKDVEDKELNELKIALFNRVLFKGYIPCVGNDKQDLTCELEMFPLVGGYINFITFHQPSDLSHKP